MFPTSNEDDGLLVRATSEIKIGDYELSHRLRTAADGRAELCQTQRMDGVGMYLQTWRGTVGELREALARAKPLPGGRRFKVTLCDIVGIIHNNTDHETGHQPQPATCDGFLSLPTEFVNELLLVLNSP